MKKYLRQSRASEGPEQYKMMWDTWETFWRKLIFMDFFFLTNLPHPARSWLHNGAFLNHWLKSAASDLSHRFYNSSASPPSCFIFFRWTSNLFYIFRFRIYKWNKYILSCCSVSWAAVFGRQGPGPGCSDLVQSACGLVRAVTLCSCDVCENCVLLLGVPL